MRQAEALPEGLSAEDLRLDGAVAPAQQAGRAGEHVHEAHPQAEDHAFDHTHSEHHPVDHPHHVHHAEQVQPTLDGFIEGWQLGLYRDAIAAGSLAAAALALLGVFIVLRRAVFAAATVGQAAGLGVVFAFYMGIHWGLPLSPVLGALLVSGAATALLALRASPRALPQDATLGLMFLAASAAAVALGDRTTQEAHEVSSILFGTAVVVSGADVMLLAVVALVVTGVVRVTWRGLAFVGFDSDGARVQNLPVRALNLGFWLMVAVTIAICTRVLGALPVFAFTVLPPISAIVTTSSLGVTLLVSSALGALCAAGGYTAAYFLALPVGATQTLMAALLLAPALLLARMRQ